MKIILIALFPFLTFGQSAQSVITPHAATVPTINYYIATGGNNSNPCTSASKCLTLAHVLTLIPRTLDANYIVNVADGTYAESIATSGFIGTGFYQAASGGTIKILGNTTTPANVVFSGTTACGGGPPSGACIQGSALVFLSGLTVTNALKEGISCYGGNVIYNKVVVTLTGGATQQSTGINNEGCHYDIVADLTITGFDTNAAPTGGLGLYNAGGTFGSCSAAATITITGNGGTGTTGFIEEYGGGSFQVLSASCAFAISAVEVGILVNGNTDFSDFVGGAISITNASVPSIVSNCIQLNGSATLNTVGSAITFTNFRVGVAANGNTAASRTGGSIMRTGLTANTSGTGNIQGF